MIAGAVRGSETLRRPSRPEINVLGCATMSTPQDAPKRRKQKARRTKQLAEWREKKVIAATKGGAPATKTEKKPAKSAK